MINHIFDHYRLHYITLIGFNFFLLFNFIQGINICKSIDIPQYKCDNIHRNSYTYISNEIVDYIGFIRIPNYFSPNKTIENIKFTDNDEFNPSNEKFNYSVSKKEEIPKILNDNFNYSPNIISQYISNTHNENYPQQDNNMYHQFNFNISYRKNDIINNNSSHNYTIRKPFEEQNAPMRTKTANNIALPTDPGYTTLPSPLEPGLIPVGDGLWLLVFGSCVYSILIKYRKYRMPTV